MNSSGYIVFKINGKFLQEYRLFFSDFDRIYCTGVLLSLFLIVSRVQIGNHTYSYSHHRINALGLHINCTAFTYPLPEIQDSQGSWQDHLLFIAIGDIYFIRRCKETI
jgi:hypothetical protein